MAAKFSAFINEDNCKCPAYTGYLNHKRPYKSRLIANSSSFSTTELSEFCLTAIKNHVKILCKCLGGMVKIYVGLLKSQTIFFIK